MRDTNKELKKLYEDYDSKTKDEKREIGNVAADLKQECVDYINDMTNDDCVGIIELVSDSWEELKEDYIKCSEQNKENRFCKTINKHKEVFQKLDEYFKEGNQWATIKLL